MTRSVYRRFRSRPINGYRIEVEPMHLEKKELREDQTPFR